MTGNGGGQTRMSWYGFSTMEMEGPQMAQTLSGDLSSQAKHSICENSAPEHLSSLLLSEAKTLHETK